MTANPSIDPARLLHEQLADASPDLLRQMLSTFIQTLMSAEADALCGAPYGTAGPERVNVRNGVPPPRLRHPGGHLGRGDPRSCVRARTSRTGCWNAAAAPRPP
jgi:hypothetical protein